MKTQFLSIGQLSRRSGIPVRRLRFYEDQGLFPGSDRAANGYRLFTDTDVIRADTIRLLRASGMSLGAIKAALDRHSDVRDLLRLRLGEIDSTISSLTRVSAAIRRAISEKNMSQDDIRRISHMMTLSNDERADAIRRFVQTVQDDPDTHSDFKSTVTSLFPASLPEDATDEQKNAWIELSELLQDPAVLDNTLRSGRRHRMPLDPKAFFKTVLEFKERGVLAVANEIPTDSPEARVIAGEYISASATHYGYAATDPDFLEYLREKSARSTGGGQWRLGLKVKGFASVGSLQPGMQWLDDAVRYYLRQENGTPASV